MTGEIILFTVLFTCGHEERGFGNRKPGGLRHCNRCGELTPVLSVRVNGCTDSIGDALRHAGPGLPAQGGKPDDFVQDRRADLDPNRDEADQP